LLKSAFAIALTLVLAGCGTMPYTPTEYPLRDGLIPKLDIAGTVAVTNAQPSTAPTIVYSYGGTKLSSDLKAITETMVRQTDGELQKNGHKTDGTARKSIGLKVNFLESNYVTFFWKSEIRFQAILGNGQTVDFSVHHSSGIALQDLNGCIAEGVMNLLNDQRIKTYLAN
jgi:hypothetical protein